MKLDGELPLVLVELVALAGPDIAAELEVLLAFAGESPLFQLALRDFSRLLFLVFRWQSLKDQLYLNLDQV